MTRRSVSVIVAAYNAARTLERALLSALSQPETAEILVVDDCSEDDTAGVALRLAARDDRVRVIALDVNGGPARARNRGIADACFPFIAILDADDFFLPGRLERLMAGPAFDFSADNIAFVDEAQLDTFELPDEMKAGSAIGLSVADFARGNLTCRRMRGELGFLKPLMSRNFLQRHGLRYNETLRLGEDYDLYLRALLAGAHFRLSPAVGYGAVVRGASLSASHSTEDLDMFHDAVAHFANAVPRGSDAFNALSAHERQIRNRRDHRRFLDLKNTSGWKAAVQYILDGPERGIPIAVGIARDKLRLRPDAVIPNDAGFRTLFDG